MFEDCIRCSEAPAVDDLGYCGHCHWAVRAEIEEGFFQLREYLRSWARYSDWCDARGVVAVYPASDSRRRKSAGALRA
jgi:hypothetical protein